MHKQRLLTFAWLAAGLAFMPFFDGFAQTQGYGCGTGNKLTDTIWGPCPKEPLPNLATAGGSTLDTYGPNGSYHLQNEDGVPLHCQDDTSAGSTSRSLYSVAGTKQNQLACKTREVGDDALANDGNQSANARLAAFPPQIEKGHDACKWRAELSNHVAAFTTSAAQNAAYGSGAAQVYGGDPSTLCMQAGNIPVDDAGLKDSHTGDDVPVGEMLAQNLVRSAADPTFQRTSAFDDWKNAGPVIGQATFKADENSPHPYDRTGANAIASISDRLFLETPAYATYNPADFRPGQEMKLVKELQAKTPLEVAEFKENMQIDWLKGKYAYAAGANPLGDINGIISAVQPRVAHASAMFDDPARVAFGHEERFLPRFSRDAEITIPQISFLPDVKEKMLGQLGGMLKNLAGDKLGGLLEALSGTAREVVAQAPLTRNGLARCVTAFASDSNLTNASLRQHESRIANNCDPGLLACLQAKGGYSMNSLNGCFTNINKPNFAGVITGPAGQVMNNVQRFLFNGNFSANINGITSNTLASLGGAELGKLNGILNQKLPNLRGLGTLSANAGQFFGNAGQLPKLLQNFKTQTTAQWMDGSHPFPLRAALTVASERDMYSAGTFQKVARIGPKALPLSLWSPYESAGGVAYLHDEHEEKRKLASLIGDAHAAEIGGKLFFQEIYDLRAKGNGARDVAQERAIYRRLCGGGTPSNLGPCPSHEAIGMPETNEQTGPILFDEEGQAHYAFLPDVDINFKLKNLYTVEDVESGMLPKAFASLLPLSPEQPISQVAAIVDKNGSLTHETRANIQLAADKINADFKAKGLSARITPEVIIGGLTDFVRETSIAAQQQPAQKLDQVESVLSSLGISNAFASTPVSGLAASVNIPSVRNTVYSAGARNHNQNGTDITKPRYERFNAQAILRMVYNRWLKADADDPCRCGLCIISRVCAPKPCDPWKPGFSSRCWTAAEGPAPYSGSMPPAKTRYDYGVIKNDIAYEKPINRVCRKEDTPEGKALQSNCHAYPPELTTMPFNRFVAPNGKTYHGLTWASHPLVRYVVDSVWKGSTGGDFIANVGENSFATASATLRAPMAMLNRLPMASVIGAHNQGGILPEGSTFAQYFALRPPYIKLDSTRATFGQAPGQEADPNNPIGAFIAINSGSNDTSINIDQNFAGLTFVPKDSYFAKRQSGLVNDAHAALPISATITTANGNIPISSNANRRAVMPSFGGVGGHKGGSCPVAGFDPQSSTLEQQLSQMRNYREFGVACIPQKGRTALSKTPSAMVSDVLGAQVTVASADGGGGTRTVTFPLCFSGLLNAADPAQAFPHGGGCAPPTQYNGGDALMKLGREAGGKVVVLGTGGGGPGATAGRKALCVVREVYPESGSFSCLQSNLGMNPDDMGQGENPTQRVARVMYKPDSMPSKTSSLITDAGYPSSHCSINALRACSNHDWDDLIVYDFSTPSSVTTSSSGTNITVTSTANAEENTQP